MFNEDIAKKEELSAKQKGFFQSREEMSERMNALDKCNAYYAVLVFDKPRVKTASDLARCYDCRDGSIQSPERNSP